MTTQHSGYDLDKNGVITHLEPEILEYEVKWLLGSITANKASGGGLLKPRLLVTTWQSF